MAERQTGSVLETRPRTEERIELMRAHDIRDIKVRNPEGENLGDISDIAIDRDTGCIAYAVLSHGGILGFGEKHFAIPWEAVSTHPGERGAVVDADKRTLDSDPGFSRDRMPREGDWSLIRTPPVRGAVEPATPVAERGMGTAATAAAATGVAATGAAVAAKSRLEKEKEDIAQSAARTGAAATGAAAATKSTLEKEERDIPQPAVQTVAAGWGGEQRAHTPEERATPFPARAGETIVEEVRRERPAEMETVVEEVPETRRRVPSVAHLSAADLQVSLKGMDYPANKQDLIAHARKNDAPEDVIAALEQFSEQTYQSAAEVSVEFGREVRAAPSHGHLSAANLQTYLKGMDYPAGKQDLISHARGRNAPEDVLMALEQFSEQTYQSATDVSVEFGREGRMERPVETAIRTERTGAVEMHRESATSRRAAPSLKHLSAADLQVYLKGMDYPAGKQGLIAHAREHNAPEDVIAALELFGDRTYRSAADVGAEFGNIKR